VTFLTHTGYIAEKSSTGSQSYTGVGFKPKAVIFYSQGCSDVNAWHTATETGLGFAASASQYATVGGSLAYNQTVSSHSHRLFYSDKAYGSEWDGTAYGVFTLTTFDNDGFTVNWTTAGQANHNIMYLALGGTDITNAAVVSFVSPTTATTKAVTGVGFKPDLVILIGDEDTQARISTGFAQCMGAFDKYGNQWARYAYSVHGAHPSATGTIQSTANCYIGSNETATVTQRAAFTSMDNDGFTITYGVADGSARYVGALCIKGGNYEVGSWAKTTGANGSTDVVPLSTLTGSTPGAVLLTTDAHTYSEKTRQAGCRWSIGAGDGTNNTCEVGSDKDNVNATINYQINSAAKALIVNNSDSNTEDAYCTLGTFALNSFTATWTLNNAVATEINYVAFGSNNVTFAGVTATKDNFTANTALIGVSIPGVTAHSTFTANVGDVPQGTPTAHATFTARIPLVGVSVPSETSTGIFTANVAGIGYTAPGVTATGTLTANTTDVDVSVLGVEAICTLTENLSIIDVTVPGVTARATFTAFAGITATPDYECGINVIINGSDKTSTIAPDSVQIVDQLDGRNTCTFTTRHKTSSFAGEVGQPVDIYVKSTLGAITHVYSGLITDRDDEQLGGNVTGYEYKYKCADYTTYATRHIIAWNYEDMSADDIVLHINQYFMAGEGVVAVKLASGGHVEPGITLDKAVFNYCTVADALDQIAEQCGFSWYIDYDKELHFFDRISNIADFPLTTVDCNYITLSINRTATQYRNRQWIQGGDQLSAPRTEAFLGDGKLTSFKLLYQISAVPTVTVDAVAQTTGIQGVDEDKDWYWSDNSDTLTQAQKFEVYREFCTVEYDFTETSGTTLTNKTEHAIGCDAVAYENDYMPISTGAGHWRFDLAADYIKIPHDIPIDNLGEHTFEFIVYINGFQQDARLWDKGGVHTIYINNTNKNLVIYRSGVGGGYKQYSTPLNTFTAGKYYHIQIVWDASKVTNLPTVYINNIKQTLTDGSGGAVWAFNSDSSYDAYIGNRATFDRWFDGAFLLFRLWRMAALPVFHKLSEEEISALVTEDQLKANYYAEKWRYSIVARGVPLTQNQKLSVTYQHKFPILDSFDDTVAQAARLALEVDGTGVYEAIENDGTLDDTSWAHDKATRLLDKYGDIPETIKFTSHVAGLRAGQLITINLPYLGINDSYLITEVSTSDESFVLFTYDVTAVSGESLGGWTKFFTDEAAKGRTFKINEGTTLLLVTKDVITVDAHELFSQTNGAPAHLASTDAKVGFSECTS
jgi:hypothetical protein